MKTLKLIFATLLITLIGSSVFADTPPKSESNFFIGKWHLYEISFLSTGETFDADEYLKGENYQQFKDDGSFISITPTVTSNGEWKYDSKKKNIIITGEFQGTHVKDVFKVVSTKGDKYILDYNTEGQTIRLYYQKL
ncbi:hypothetical protein [Flammeovirga kamogawensis]|uniref:Lipocalin-like domain-containing protein n=1 Tax=Flammeovirga kamogawensis TaxID=373891 RepID=A0ABX8GVL0_9BACT|nr:hypothetical protein [Flammeovirga kamogawensis]MBB6459681.1 hypothetical protein [Flammeovirga kamogawensis]QWG07257.1 hypothetical protein KM029_18435 [Flammeovirga kamogawensis]TRX69077.1 hypothetical protein EO216_13425 [Flammeovirga kamogawensis]